MQKYSAQTDDALCLLCDAGWLRGDRAALGDGNLWGYQSDAGLRAGVRGDDHLHRCGAGERNPVHLGYGTSQCIILHVPDAAGDGGLCLFREDEVVSVSVSDAA